MNPGEIDKRTLVLDAGWASPEDLDPSEDEDEDEGMLDFYGNGSGNENGEEDEDEESDDEEGEDNGEEQGEDESEIEPLPPPCKHKRPMEPLKESATRQKEGSVRFTRTREGYSMYPYTPTDYILKKRMSTGSCP